MQHTSGKILMIVLMIAIVTAYGCKKEETGAGVVTFTLGSVNIQHQGQEPTACNVKDAVREPDTIVTGPASMAVVQFSDNCTVQIYENTTFKILASGEKSRELFLKDGQMMTRLVKGESSGLNVKTPTAIAGVRGTRFSVNYSKGVTQVAVDEGKVAVTAARHDETGKTADESAVSKEEIMTEAGKTAEVRARTPLSAGEEAALVINVRDITKDEKQNLKKFSAVPIIEDIEKKSIEEIESVIRKGISSYTQDQQSRIKNLMAKPARSIDEIREVFNRVDEVTLYNGRVIQGAILSRGKTYRILAPDGVVTVMEDEIKTSTIVE
ncbi:MAG: FecR domain-containing protein [Spirochaetes bacterium]|nr:FecR domain-containing protein [Spirochaetota bacterium]